VSASSRRRAQICHLCKAAGRTCLPAAGASAARLLTPTVVTPPPTFRHPTRGALRRAWRNERAPQRHELGGCVRLQIQSFTEQLQMAASAGSCSAASPWGAHNHPLSGWLIHMALGMQCHVSLNHMALGVQCHVNAPPAWHCPPGTAPPRRRALHSPMWPGRCFAVQHLILSGGNKLRGGPGGLWQSGAPPLAAVHSWEGGQEAGGPRLPPTSTAC